MFSLLGVLFGMPLAEVLAPLAIGEAVQGALLRQDGELGLLLRAIEAAEQGRFDTVAGHLAALQISTADFNNAIVDATRWMLDTVRDSQGSHA
jgi:EAL and modified HD-GYP domain-containing signal transduction protein